MSRLRTETIMLAPPERCFDLARIADLHAASASVIQSKAAPRRKRGMDWKEHCFEAGRIALTLACAAEGVFRLLWAVQP